MAKKGERTVLPSHIGGGPHGLGDPDDRRLRNVEKEVTIPGMMRDKAKKEKCANEVKDFHECIRVHGTAYLWRCRKENDSMRNCQVRWYQDDEFRRECTEEFLRLRSEYRSTGLTIKQRDFLAKHPSVTIDDIRRMQQS